VRPWFLDLQRRLDDIGALEENWGSYHEAPITAEAIDVSRRLLAVLAMLAEIKPTLSTQICPTPPGGIQLEWHEGGWNAEIEVEPDGSISIWCSDGGKREFCYPPDSE
jgi:hypothetical protein